MTKTIVTAAGNETLQLKPDGRGFRKVMLDGTQIGWMHSTYDGWAVMIQAELPRKTQIAKDLKTAMSDISDYLRGIRRNEKA